MIKKLSKHSFGYWLGGACIVFGIAQSFLFFNPPSFNVATFSLIFVGLVLMFVAFCDKTPINKGDK